MTVTAPVAAPKLSKGEKAAVALVAAREKTLGGLKADLKAAQALTKGNAKLALTTAPKVVAALQKNAGATVENLQQAVAVAQAELDESKAALKTLRANEKAAAQQKARDDKAAAAAKAKAAAEKEKAKAAKAAPKAAAAPAVAAAPAAVAAAPKAAKVAKAKKA